jgi:hypothetical protein
MEGKIFRKALIVGIICILMLPTVAVAIADNNSNYNLKVKIKNTRLLYNFTTDLRFSVIVTNEGPDSSDNYSVKIEIFQLFAYGRLIKDWFKWTGAEKTYTGSPIASDNYEKTKVDFTNFGPGWYLVRATMNTKDTNPDDNVSYCVVHVHHFPLWNP